MPKLILRSNSSLNQDEKDRRLFNYMVLGAYALMAQIFTNLYFKVEIELSPARLVDLANFVARRPFQYRVLVPAIVHICARLVHATRFEYYPIYQFIEIACVFATLIAFRCYLSQFMDFTRAALLAGTIVIPMVMIHISCAICMYPSDTPAIMLFIVGLIALHRRAYVWLYAVLALATINRESSALLVVAFAATMLGQLPWRRYAGHLAGLSLVWLAVKLSVDHIFSHNPGWLAEDHLAYNRALVLQLLHGQPNVAATAVFLATIPTAIILGRKLVPDFLLRLLVIAPFYAVVMWQVGVFDEVRAWNEVVPVLLTPLAVLLSRLADRIAAAESTLPECTVMPIVAKRKVSASNS